MSTPILFVFGVAFLHGFLAVYEHCRLVVLASVFCYVVSVFHLAALQRFSVYTVYCLSGELSTPKLAPLGGIEPHAVHPTLRIGLEDRCRAQG